MSDETAAPPPPSPAPPSEPAGASPAPRLAVPTIIVRGGTTSSAFDTQVAELKADQLRRQAEQDQEIQLVRKEGARRYEMDLGTPNKAPVAVIQVEVGAKREQFIQADVVVSSDASGGLVMQLVIICPKCVSRNIPQSQAQLTIDSRNKRWSLDERTAGQVWIEPGTENAYVLAGTVDVAETCSCPNVGCGFKFRISNKSEYPGVSRLLREY